MRNEIETVVEKARTNISTRAELPGMSLLEHLEELRRRIIWSALSVAAPGTLKVTRGVANSGVISGEVLMP